MTVPKVDNWDLSIQIMSPRGSEGMPLTSGGTSSYEALWMKLCSNMHYDHAHTQIFQAFSDIHDSLKQHVSEPLGHLANSCFG